MAVSEAKIRANARYTKKAYKKVAIYLNKDSNKDIIECLDGVKSKNAFIIRKYEKQSLNYVKIS